MKIPPEITYRGIDKTDALDTLVNEKIAKLEQVCDHISSCHVAIEKENDRPKHGSPYRVRLDITVPPGHELFFESTDLGDQKQFPKLEAIIRDAFSKAWRQLRDLSRQQKEHDRGQLNDGAYDTTALITQLFPEEGHGYLKTLDGEDIHFNANSVANNDFDRLAIGTGVRFEAVEDEEGRLHATTVQIVDKPGARVGTADETLIDAPLDWR